MHLLHGHFTRMACMLVGGGIRRSLPCQGSRVSARPRSQRRLHSRFGPRSRAEWRPLRAPTAAPFAAPALPWASNHISPAELVYRMSGAVVERALRATSCAKPESCSRHGSHRHHYRRHHRKAPVLKPGPCTCLCTHSRVRLIRL